MIYLHSRTHSNFSRGQALSESLILIGVFSLLFVGIQVTGSIQILSVQTLLKSVKHAFELSLGHVAQSRINHEIYTFKNQHNLSLTVHHVLDDLRMGHPGFLRLSVSLQPSKNYLNFVTRSTFVDAGYGHGESDSGVQQKIAASAPLWRDAFQKSSKEMKEIYKHASRVDHAWTRPLLDIDLIQPWEGVVPEQVKTRNHAWKD